jgi:ABC-type polar amino acid transport system ATPase subunit
MIQLENIEFSYNENKILSIKELNIYPVKKFSSYGPSGSGKNNFTQSGWWVVKTK